MSEVTGKMLTCDRCGDTVFLKEGKYLYEKAPKGWAYHSESALVGAYGGHLCPDCERTYMSICKDFMARKSFTTY